MAELKHHAWLISIILMLATLKFIIVPIVNWQDQIIVDINLLKKKQAKITNVLSQQTDNTETSDQLTIALKASFELFVIAKNESNFKLTQQKKLEALLAKYKLTSQNIGWQTPSFLAELAITRYPLQLRFSGKTVDVIEFITELESQKQLTDIANFNFSLAGQNEKKLGKVTGNITVNLYANIRTTR